MLTYVDLQWSALIGDIPPPVGYWHELNVLKLEFNELAGAIPVEHVQACCAWPRVQQSSGENSTVVGEFFATD